MKVVRIGIGILLTMLSLYASAEERPVPVLRVIAPNGKASLLIGSLHVGTAELRQPTQGVFDGARVFVVEHFGSRTPPKAQGNEKGPSLAPWAVDLAEVELQTYFLRARCAGIPPELTAQALTYRSVTYANQVAYTVCEDAARYPSRDSWLEGLAQQRAVPFVALEDDEWIEAQRAKTSDADSSVALRWILQRDPKVVLSGVVRALNAGDYDQVAALWRQSFGSEAAPSSSEAVMVQGRNRAWMPRLRNVLGKGDAIVLVGATHLAGPQGLVALLRRDGFQVTAVAVPAAD